MEHPQSKGFWRRNAIDGLRLELEALRLPFQDPEQKSRFHAALDELRLLQCRECAVRDRMARLKSRR